MHEIYEDFILCVCQQKYLLHKYIPLTPWAPTVVLSSLLLCANGNGIEKTEWWHYGIVEKHRLCDQIQVKTLTMPGS